MGRMEELAKLGGISRQALYKRLKKAGVDISAIRSGQGLTEEGEATILQVLGIDPCQPDCKPVDNEFTKTCQPDCKPVDNEFTESNKIDSGLLDPGEGSSPNEASDCQPVDNGFTETCKQVDSQMTTKCQPDREPGDNGGGVGPVGVTIAPEEVLKLKEDLKQLKEQLADQRHRADIAELKAETAANERDYLREQLDNAIKATALASMKRLETAENNSRPVGIGQRLAAAWAAFNKNKDKD